MSKPIVIVDSVGCLPPQMVQECGMMILPLNLLVGERVYRDGVDLTATQAYELFLKDPKSFKTSGPSPGECQATFRAAARISSEILSICVSSKLSTTYNVVQAAATRVMDEMPGTRIEVMDSYTCAVAEGLMALQSARAASRGGSFQDITAQARQIKDKVHFIVFLDTIKYVYRTGRVPRIASQAGSILSIKPVLAMSEGALHLVGIARTRKAGIEQLVKRLQDKAAGKKLHAAVTHAYAPEDAAVLRQEIERRFDCREMWTGEFSPLMGYATGTGTLGIGFYTED